MLRNYFKTALRHLLNNRLYSAITILGLTLGIAVGLLILLWVKDETGYDRFHRNIGNIYKVGIDGGGTGEKKQIFSEIIAPVAPFAKREIPEVIDAVRITNAGATPLFSYREQKMTEDQMLAFTDASFFSIFDFPLIKGNPHNPFPSDFSMVVTESTARKYFGEEEPVGKVLTADGKDHFTITGVIKDFPANSSIRFNMLVPSSLFNRFHYIDNATSYNGTGRIASMDADWVNFGFDVYLLLRPGANVDIIKKKLQAIHERNKPDDAPVPYLMRNMADLHLTTIDGEDAGLRTVKIFSIIALLILMVACINYVNLSTARSTIRAKETGMRKVTGASRMQLFFQFIFETTLLFCIAAVLAIGVMYLLMPAYNLFSGKQLGLVLSDYHIWQVIGITLLSTLVVASIYPALLLSSFNPLSVLKGKTAAGIGNVTFRKVLVVAQFTISFLMITGTMIINRQLNFIQHSYLGYNKENIFYLRFPHLDQHYQAVRAGLLKQPGVAGVTRSSSNIVDFDGWTGDDDYDGKPLNTTLYLHSIEIDESYIPFYDIKIKEGSNFEGTISDSAKFIVNEAAVAQMGYKDPIGKRLRVRKTTGTIAGVVKDFHFTSMRKKIEPVVLIYDPGNCWHLSVKTMPGAEQQATAAAQRLYKQYNDLPFNYTFLNDSFDRLYKNEQQTGSLFSVFSAIAIIISCLGLFGLATYTAHVKTREIGIRKVLGASVAGIVRLLSADFLKLVALSIIIATPVAWVMMNRWLQDFAYRVRISWIVFAIAGLLSLAIALITVSFRTISAAIANPVKSLKSE